MKLLIRNFYQIFLNSKEMWTWRFWSFSVKPWLG